MNASAFVPLPPPFFASTPLCVRFLSQGAEARVWAGTYLGRACVIKTRMPKPYRHPDLDASLTHERFVGEARALVRARRARVDAPYLLLCEPLSATLVLEFIDGCTFKAWLYRGARLLGQRAAEAVAYHVGIAIARLHAAGVSHGDLTTSNVMLRGLPEDGGDAAAAAVQPIDLPDPGDEVIEGNDGDGVEEGRQLSEADEEARAIADAARFLPTLVTGSAAGGSSPRPSPPLLPVNIKSVALIDFGLASMNCSVEDCGVDLYVLERAFISAHPTESASLFAAVISAYGAELAHLVPAGGSKDAKAILGKFAAVRLRGRKRLAFG